MNRIRLHQLLVRGLVATLAVIFILLPFHAFLTVWGSSLVGHYTVLRLWKEVLMVLAGLLALGVVCLRPKLRQKIVTNHLWQIMALYIIVTLVWAGVAYWRDSVTAKAALYGVLINTRFLFMFMFTWVAASQSHWLRRYWQRLVVYPAAVVVAFGLAQRWLLPYDVLRHFGYGPDTIKPYQTVDKKISYLRVMSTLRGANLFGGYLIIVVSYIAVVSHWLQRRWLAVIAMLATMGALFASGSRGAWLGVVVALAVVAALRFGRRLLHRGIIVAALAALLLSLGSLYAMRNNDFVQNTFFHTDEHSVSDESSNTAHLRSSWGATKQVFYWQEALGRGPGTAGPASYYNEGHAVRIAENYFLQIGQEVGWLGLGLFLAIYAGTAKLLWQQRKNALGQTLLASMAGLTVMAMLMHIWADDTISYIWWGLAGIALAPAVKSREKSK